MLSWFSGLVIVAVTLPPLQVVAPFLTFGAVVGALAWQASLIARGRPVKRVMLYLALLVCPPLGTMLGALSMLWMPASMIADGGPDASLYLACVCGTAGGFVAERVIALAGDLVDKRAARVAAELEAETEDRGKETGGTR